MADVGWDFVKGMIVFKQEADDGSYRVKKIEKITPLNSPFIGMKVPLSRAPGSVSKIGEVQFDIKEGDHFTNNLVVNDIEQNTISSFFKSHFEGIPKEQRVYKLGTISNYEDEQFQPEKFDIRTMGTPNTQSRGSQDEGDGAVVLFVQVKNGSKEHGKTEVDWLLADDYTSALVVSNSRLFDGMVKGPVETGSVLGQRIGKWHYVSDSGDNLAGELQADSGTMEKTASFTIDNSAYFHQSLGCVIYLDMVKSDSQNIPISIRPAYKDSDKYDICCEFKHVGDGGRYRFIEKITYPGQEKETVIGQGEFSINLHFQIQYSAVVNNDIVSFVEKPEWLFKELKT
ncbi:hypothetical protein Q4S25_21625, partial [Morganella morganii]